MSIFGGPSGEVVVNEVCACGAKFSAMGLPSQIDPYAQSFRQNHSECARQAWGGGVNCVHYFDLSSTAPKCEHCGTPFNPALHGENRSQPFEVTS